MEHLYVCNLKYASRRDAFVTKIIEEVREGMHQRKAA